MKALCFKKEQITKAVCDVNPETLVSVESEIRSKFKVGNSYSLFEAKKSFYVTNL